MTDFDHLTPKGIAEFIGDNRDSLEIPIEGGDPIIAIVPSNINIFIDGYDTDSLIKFENILEGLSRLYSFTPETPLIDRIAIAAALEPIISDLLGHSSTIVILPKHREEIKDKLFQFLDIADTQDQSGFTIKVLNNLYEIFYSMNHFEYDSNVKKDAKIAKLLDDNLKGKIKPLDFIRSTLDLFTPDIIGMVDSYSEFLRIINNLEMTENTFKTISPNQENYLYPMHVIIASLNDCSYDDYRYIKKFLLYGVYALNSVAELKKIKNSDNEA